MKIAVLSESPADEAAIRILVDGILGRPAQPIGHPPLRTGGWPFVLQNLPNMLRHLHYRTEAESLVVVVDSDSSPIHLMRDPAQHHLHKSKRQQRADASKHCRSCQLREAVEQEQDQLQPVTGRGSIKIAVGIAIPTIEAWYRCGLDSHVTETAWIQGLESGTSPYTSKSLKQAVYGTDRPSLELETKRATEEAGRLVHDLDTLERFFPNGFGALARDVRSW